MSRWGKPTKNTRRRDPRYFLNENTLESALRNSEKNDNPVIAISKNQFIQVRQVVQYDENDQPVVTGNAVDFGTLSKQGANGYEIAGSGKLAYSDGPNASKAIDDALQKLQQLSDQGIGPYGTAPVELSAPVRIL